MPTATPTGEIGQVTISRDAPDDCLEWASANRSDWQSRTTTYHPAADPYDPDWCPHGAPAAFTSEFDQCADCRADAIGAATDDDGNWRSRYAIAAERAAAAARDHLATLAAHDPDHPLLTEHWAMTIYGGEDTWLIGERAPARRTARP